jgi:hypothetical protein
MRVGLILASSSPVCRAIARPCTNSCTAPAAKQRTASRRHRSTRFGRRASCHKFQRNQLRLLLAGLAYTLMINLRRLALRGTELEHACTATIRVKLLKIGAALVRNTRRVRVLLASQHPLKQVFRGAARALAP